MQGSQALPPLRTRVYIDGFNFYYGCLKGTPYKWLDLLPLFEQHILPSALVRNAQGIPYQFTLLRDPAIRFFTAGILESVARAEDSVSSQQQYHKALNLVHGNQIEIMLGYYSVQSMWVKSVDAEVPKRHPKDCQKTLIWKVEEKQSDVNLALQVYHDALTKQVDHVVIVTNDTDIAPALKMIREHTEVIVGLVVPTRPGGKPTSDAEGDVPPGTPGTRRTNRELEQYAHWTRAHIRPEELAACQLPRVIQGRRPATKPISWYAEPELLQKILDLAIPVTGSRSAAFKWMQQPCAQLDNAKPIDLIETKAGAEQVLDYQRAYVTEVVQQAGDGLIATPRPPVAE